MLIKSLTKSDITSLNKVTIINSLIYSALFVLNRLMFPMNVSVCHHTYLYLFYCDLSRVVLTSYNNNKNSTLADNECSLGVFVRRCSTVSSFRFVSRCF